MVKSKRPKMQNIKGFAGIDRLLIFLIVGILPGTGWYVWNARNKTNDGLTNAANSSVPRTVNPRVNPPVASTADWAAYSNKTAMFSLKYPKTWKTAANQEDRCTPGGVLLLGADSVSVGSCG